MTDKCLRKGEEKCKYLINRNFSQLTIHQTESDGFPGAIVTKAPVSLSPRRGVDFHWRGCSLVQHDFNTVYSGPDWKGTPRCLPSSTESAPRWSRNATPSLHPATRKKKRRERGRKRDSCRTLRNVRAGDACTRLAHFTATKHLLLVLLCVN